MNAVMQGARRWDRLRAMGGGQHRDNSRHQYRRRRNARFPARVAGRPEKADIVGLDQRRNSDAWSSEPETRRQIEESLSHAGMKAPTLAVSRSYLDRMVAHHLALDAEKGEMPSLGLLQVAETIGGAAWQPARMAFVKRSPG